MTGVPLCRRKCSTTRAHSCVTRASLGHAHVDYMGRCNWCGEQELETLFFISTFHHGFKVLHSVYSAFYKNLCGNVQGQTQSLVHDQASPLPLTCISGPIRKVFEEKLFLLKEQSYYKKQKTFYDNPPKGTDRMSGTWGLSNLIQMALKGNL